MGKTKVNEIMKWILQSAQNWIFFMKEWKRNQPDRRWTQKSCTRFFQECFQDDWSIAREVYAELYFKEKKRKENTNDVSVKKRKGKITEELRVRLQVNSLSVLWHLQTRKACWSWFPRKRKEVIRKNKTKSKTRRKWWEHAFRMSVYLSRVRGYLNALHTVLGVRGHGGVQFLELRVRNGGFGDVALASIYRALGSLLRRLWRDHLGVVCDGTRVRGAKKYFLCVSNSTSPTWKHHANKHSRVDGHAEHRKQCIPHHR